MNVCFPFAAVDSNIAEDQYVSYDMRSPSTPPQACDRGLSRNF